jgi:hypothetical protein
MAPKRKRKAQKKLRNKSGTNSHYPKKGIEHSQIKRASSPDNTKNHQNQRVTVTDWAYRFKLHLNLLSQDQCEIVFLYLIPIRNGIHDAAQDDVLRELESFEQIKESFEYNLLIKAIPYILSKKPKKSSVYRWAKRLAVKRKYSWMTSLIRQRESIQIMPNPYKLIFDEERNIVDFSFTDSEWKPQINPPGHDCDPEKFLLDMETYKRVDLLPSIIGSSKRKRTSEYLQILSAQLDGSDVKSGHGPQFGIPHENVASIKNQLKEALRKILIQDDPDLADRIVLYKAQRGKSCKIEKSTFEERRALHRDPYSGQKIACTIRIWRALDGNKRQAADSDEIQAGAVKLKTRKNGKAA